MRLCCSKGLPLQGIISRALGFMVEDIARFLLHWKNWHWDRSGSGSNCYSSYVKLIMSSIWKDIQIRNIIATIILPTVGVWLSLDTPFVNKTKVWTLIYYFITGIGKSLLPMTFISYFWYSWSNETCLHGFLLPRHTSRRTTLSLSL
jgi:hypothetical protein